MQILTQKLLK